MTSADDGTPGVLDGSADDTIEFGFPGVLEKPFAADFNLDGIDDVGLMVPNQIGETPSGTSEWYFLISDAALQNNGTVDALNHQFSPDPLGNDLFAQFGSNLGLPLVGNFDPPVARGNSDVVQSNSGTSASSSTPTSQPVTAAPAGIVESRGNDPTDPGATTLYVSPNLNNTAVEDDEAEQTTSNVPQLNGEAELDLLADAESESTTPIGTDSYQRSGDSSDAIEDATTGDETTGIVNSLIVDLDPLTGAL